MIFVLNFCFKTFLFKAFDEPLVVASSRSLENQQIHVTTPRATRRKKCPRLPDLWCEPWSKRERDNWQRESKNWKIEVVTLLITHYSTISNFNKAEICCKDAWFQELQVLIYGVMQNYAKHACMIMIDHVCIWHQFWSVNFQVLLHILHWPMQALERLCRQTCQDIFSVCHGMESWHLFP